MTTTIDTLPRDDDGRLMARTWPGQYPIYYVDGENAILCPSCARESDTEEELDSFRPVAADVNYEDPELQCDNCSKPIPCAYPTDDDDEGPPFGGPSFPCARCNGRGYIPYRELADEDRAAYRHSGLIDTPHSPTVCPQCDGIGEA